MKIVVLDGHTLNPGDLDWAPLQALGVCEIHARSSAERVVPRAHDAEIVLTNKTVLTRDMIFQLPKARYIGVLATGHNVVDSAAAAERKIPVTNVPAYGTTSVAQMVFAHLLQLTHNVAAHAESVRKGDWAQCEDFCYWRQPLLELAGLTMGIVGFGRIGRATGLIARAMGMHVIYYNSSNKILPIEEGRRVELVTLFRESDVVTLHCPLTPETKGLVNAQRLSTMKRSAFLINTSRGPLVDESALADALNQGMIAGAGLDVLNVEPPAVSNPLYSAKNCYITPHIAWATRAARQRLLAIAIQNVRAFLNDRCENVVN